MSVWLSWDQQWVRPMALPPVPFRPCIPEPLPHAHYGLSFWDLWLGGRHREWPAADQCPCGPSPVLPVCSLPNRFLRDYDALFPVADDVSLLQQASSVLYPFTAATGMGLGLTRSEMGC